MCYAKSNLNIPERLHRFNHISKSTWHQCLYLETLILQYVMKCIYKLNCRVVGFDDNFLTCKVHITAKKVES